MKNIKSVFRILVMKSVMIAIIAFGFVSCNEEELNSNNAENIVTANLKKGKIDICHYSVTDDKWFVLNVNENAWGDHSLHGDVWLDQDGDGYTIYNECGIGTMDDCDDTNPDQYPGAENLGYFQLWEDADGDGWSVLLDEIYSDCRPNGYLSTAESIAQILYFDCDDTNPDVNPASPEICDDIDNNCDGLLKDRAAVLTFQGTDYYGVSSYARFGPAGTVTGEWVDINDTYCVAGADDFTGKIVFIDRGACLFVDKIKNAQDNGAIGVIICSSTGLVVMVAPYDPGITIPSIMTTSGNCDILQSEPIVSFRVEESCVEPSANRTINTRSAKSNVKLEFMKTHTFDQKTGEFVKIENTQQ